MKRVLVLAVVPALLLALEKVNLIKNAGFEKDSDVWLMRSYADGEYDSTITNHHDSDSAYVGIYCGSIDTRIRPAESLPSLYHMTGELYQILLQPKKLKDLDSLEVSHMTVFREEGNKLSTVIYSVTLEFTDPSNDKLTEGVYRWAAPDLSAGEDTPTRKLFSDTIYAEGVWYTLSRDLNVDLVQTKGLSSEIELDSIILLGGSQEYGIWRGQKAFFDGIRLTGYADYNVALTRLSGDLVYPAAIVWNNGREDQSDVKVICIIEGDRPEPYADTVILPGLASDDSVEVKFKENQWISGSSDYNLIVECGELAGTDPDESDEDDRLTKFYPCAVSEPTTPAKSQDALTLEVKSFAANPRISYSLPWGKQGTITLYDPSGRRIESFRVQEEGGVSFKSKLAPGVYFIRLETGHLNVTRKAVVLD